MNPADKLAALREAMLTRPAADESYADIVLEHPDGSCGFTEAGAHAAERVLNATPAIEALIRAVAFRKIGDMAWPARCRFCDLVTEDPDAYFVPEGEVEYLSDSRVFCAQAPHSRHVAATKDDLIAAAYTDVDKALR